MSGYEIGRLSPSQINTFRRCGMLYYNVYVLARRKLPGIALHKGASVHDGAGANLANVIAVGELLPLEHVKDIVVDSFNKKLDEEGVKEEDRELVGAAKDSAIILSELHYTRLAPEIKPIAVEKPIAAEIEGISVIGYIDVREAGRVRELKTRSANKGVVKDSDLDRNIQGIFYQYAEELDGATDCEFMLDGLVDTKVKQVSSLGIKYGERDFDYLKYNVAILKQALERGDFYPCPSDYWQCTSKWCAWFEECAYGSRRKVQK